MTESEFNLPGLQSDCKVKYAVGQPMGLYSSWPAMALTNHALVRLAAVKVGLKKFKDYMILGDDIVIFNSNVAKTYQHLLNFINVEVGEFDSIKASPQHCFEMAKRLFREGREIGPLPFRQFQSAFGLFALVCYERGFSGELKALCPKDHPSHKTKMISLTAASLLFVWRSAPNYRADQDFNDKYVKPAPNSLLDSLLELPPQNPWVLMTEEGHSRYIELTERLFEA